MGTSSSKLFKLFIGITVFALLGVIIYWASEKYEPEVGLRKEVGFYKGISSKRLSLNNAETRKINNCIRRNRRTVRKAVLTVLPDGFDLKGDVDSGDPLKFKLKLTGSSGIELDVGQDRCLRGSFVNKVVDSIEKGAVVLSHYEKDPALKGREVRIMDM